MEEQVNQQIFSLTIQCAYGVGRAFQRVAEKVAHEGKQILQEKENAFLDKMNDLSAPKEVSLKELIKSGDQVDSISLGVGDRMAFEPVLRKYGITYAIKKDRTQNPPTYHFLFKAKDATVLKMAFQEYMEKKMKVKESGKGILQKIKKYKALAASLASKAKVRFKSPIR